MKNKTTDTKLYRIWGNMKQRCYNPNSSGYERYGGVGVTMCDEWRDSFASFKKWSLSNGYEDGLSIDKDILCDKMGIYPKTYSPRTCMFITQEENTKYRSKITPSKGFKNIDMACFYSTTTQTIKNWKNGNTGQQRRYKAMVDYYTNRIK